MQCTRKFWSQQKYKILGKERNPGNAYRMTKWNQRVDLWKFSDFIKNLYPAH